MERQQHGMMRDKGHARPYLRLVGMIVLSFASMYTLMYAMVNSFENVYSSFNQLYMASLMTAPMVLIELLLMKDMYPSKNLNLILLAASAIVGIASFGLIRQQTAIGDNQFLRSMIPHHAGAILMCEEAHVQSPEIKQLCQGIIASQQSEIDQMKSLLSRK